MFMSEVAHRSFCVEVSGLISERRILEKSYLSLRKFNLQISILFLKLRKSTFQGKEKIYGAPINPSELFWKFITCGVIIFS